jgi:hypothetical protein
MTTIHRRLLLATLPAVTALLVAATLLLALGLHRREERLAPT